MVGDALGGYWNGARPVLELYKTAQLRITPFRVLEFIKRKTGNFQDIDASKPRIWFSSEYAPHCDCESLAKRFMARFKINRCQYDGCIGEVACHCAAEARRRISGCAQPSPEDGNSTAPPRADGALSEGDLFGMLQIESELSSGRVTRLRIDLQTAQDDLL